MADDVVRDIPEEMVEAGARALAVAEGRLDGPRPYHLKEARVALSAALAGRTVLDLPNPDERQDECGVMAGTWHLRDVTVAFRTRSFMSYVIDGEPCVFDGPGPEHSFTVTELRERCIVGLAACADAKRLAAEVRAAGSGVSDQDG